MKVTPYLLLALFISASSLPAAPEVIRLWPDAPPGKPRDLPPEVDTTRPDGNLVAGKRVIRLGNVTTPTLTVYPAPAQTANGASVIVCPGGGHHILAWDLEGTEVAEWLNAIGVTAFLLKYRVPARDPNKRWEMAVQDAQRSVSLVRHRAREWKIDRIGILGFSAGGETAGLTALFEERQYPPVDVADRLSMRPDFAVLVYAAGMVDEKTGKLRDYIRVNRKTPPMFFAHALDDQVPVENSVMLFLELKRHGVPAELHAYSAGGHGYGLRITQDPVTTWHHRCADWMRVCGLLNPGATSGASSR